MAAGTEVERLIVRLIGDGSSYQKMLVDATNATKAATEKIGSLVGRIASFGDSIKSVGAQLTVSLTRPLLDFAMTAVQAFGQQEAAERMLTAALRTNGRAVEQVLEKHKAFASELENLGLISGDATLKMLQMAESLGVSGANARRAVRNAIGLAEATGMSTKAAMRYTAALEHGETKMLTRFLPTLAKIKDESERAAVALNLLSDFFDIARARAQTAEGSIARMHLVIVGLQATIGETVAPYVIRFADAISGLLMKFQALSPELQSTIVHIGGMFAAIGPSLLIVGQLSSAITSIIAVMGGWPLAFAAVITGAAILGRELGKLTGLIKEQTEVVGINEEAYKRIKKRLQEEEQAANLAKQKASQLNEEVKSLTESLMIQANALQNKLTPEETRIFEMELKLGRPLEEARIYAQAIKDVRRQRELEAESEQNAAQAAAEARRKQAKATQELAARIDKLRQRGKSIAESLRTPLEVYKDEIKELRQLFAGGFISKDTLLRGAQRALETLEDTKAKQPDGFSRGGGGAARGAAAIGSLEARNRVMAFESRIREGKEGKKQTDLLAKIEENTRKEPGEPSEADIELAFAGLN